MRALTGAQRYGRFYVDADEGERSKVGETLYEPRELVFVDVAPVETETFRLTTYYGLGNGDFMYILWLLMLKISLDC